MPWKFHYFSKIRQFSEFIKKGPENFKTWPFWFQCIFVLQFWKYLKTYSQMKYEWFFDPLKRNFATASKIRPFHNMRENEGRFRILEKIFFTQLFIIVDYLIPWKEQNWRPRLPKCSQIGPSLWIMSRNIQVFGGISGAVMIS